jgi:methylmalonyl-CoA mutase
MATTAPEILPEAEALKASIAHWRGTVEAELKGEAFDKKLLTRTYEGITLRPLYTRADAQTSPADDFCHRNLNTKREGRENGAWEITQRIAASDAVEFNRRLRADLMAGQNAVLLAGTSARSAELATALAGVDTSCVAVHIEAGPDAREAGEALLALGKGDSLRGSVTADPLGAWAKAGALPAALPALYDALAAWTNRAAVSAPALRTIGVDARCWAEAGGTAVDELAAALAAVAEYLRELTARGLPVESIVPRLRVSFGAGPQFLMETAKFRAWRGLLARVVTAWGGDAMLAGRAALHAGTTRWNTSRLDAHVNMLRATTQAFSAVLGGVDSLEIAPYDAVDGDGTGDDFARRIARNVHVLLAEEFGAAAPVDPAGGAWAIERLTDELSRKAWELFQRHEQAGGLAAAMRAGEPQRLVAEAAKEKSRAVGARRHGLVGVNLFPNLRETPLAASGPASAGLGCAGWQAERITPLAPFRAAAGFERLRDASAAHQASTGSRPKVFLAKMGPLAQHKARADFSAGFFAPGGFEVAGKQSFATAEDAARATVESGAPVAVLCSTDETYPELVPAFTAAVRAARPGMVLVLAGMPADDALRAAYTAAGMDEFIHLRASVEEVLAKLLNKIGAL